MSDERPEASPSDATKTNRGAAEETRIIPGSGVSMAAARATIPLRSAERRAGGMDAATFYAQIGGHDTFARIVHGFYERVKTDDILAPMYPQGDFEGAEWRLTAFLEQYWGGPTDYSDQRGHPRLRMRHMPFRVDQAARDRWLTLMREALDDVALPPLQDATLWDYLERAAHSLVNTPG